MSHSVITWSLHDSVSPCGKLYVALVRGAWTAGRREAVFSTGLGDSLARSLALIKEHSFLPAFATKYDRINFHNNDLSYYGYIFYL